MTLEIKEVCCGYQNNLVVDGFSSKISSGEIFCLLGPNGIGKTTLFKTILGLLPLMGGRITIDDRDIATLNVKEYARLIGYVPQAHVPPFSFGVFDVVAMGRTAHLGIFGNPSRRDFEISYDCLERLEISHLADRIYTELSGGERQMVLIARALAQEPAFLMMDEPTSNLDFGNQVRVLQIVKKLAEQGLGIIMTTHFPDHVFQCDANVALMLRGNRYISGTAREVITEETLREAYGIEVAIMSALYKGEDLHFCQPLMAKNPAEKMEQVADTVETSA